MNTPYFIQIIVREKGKNDWRAFLQWCQFNNSTTMYEIRGYGDTAGKAADDAYRRFTEDPLFYS